MSNSKPSSNFQNKQYYARIGKILNENHYTIADFKTNPFYLIQSSPSYAAFYKTKFVNQESFTWYGKPVTNRELMRTYPDQDFIKSYIANNPEFEKYYNGNDNSEENEPNTNGNYLFQKPIRRLIKNFQVTQEAQTVHQLLRDLTLELTKYPSLLIRTLLLIQEQKENLLLTVPIHQVVQKVRSLIEIQSNNKTAKARLQTRLRV